jgi:hypothetical protein
MIQDTLSKQIFRNLSRLDLSPPSINTYRFKDTLKQCLLNSVDDPKITIESENKIKIEIQLDELRTALFTDFHFGYRRIKEQVKNVNNLIDSGSQVAWIVTTAYYACYFMAIEIAKLYGIFIINFSDDEFTSILTSSRNANNFHIKTETNNSFQVSVNPSSYTSFLDLQLVRESSRPHQIAWKNLSKILQQLSIDDRLSHHKSLLIDICTNSRRWVLPSTIRNEWNYTYANYYSNRGTELGDRFLSIIKKTDSAMSWANYKNLQPDDRNITASIAYLYHCLYETIENIDRRFYPP